MPATTKRYRRRRGGSKKSYKKSRRHSKKSSRRNRRGGKGDPDPRWLKAYPQYTSNQVTSYKDAYPNAKMHEDEKELRNHFNRYGNSKIPEETNTKSSSSNIEINPVVNEHIRQTNDANNWSAAYPNAQNSIYG